MYIVPDGRKLTSTEFEDDFFGIIELRDGAVTTFGIEVTAADGETIKTYTFHVGRGVSASLTVTDATVNGTSLVLTYSESLDAASKPNTGAYTVTVAGSPAAVSDVSISGATVTLTLTTAVTGGQTVTVSYTRPSTNPVQNTSGDDAPSFSNQAVTNLTNAPPTAVHNTVTTNEDTAYPFTVANFGFSDTDTGDELVSVKITSLETDGDLALNGVGVVVDQEIANADIDAGNLTFTPALNAHGSAHATFEFKVNDGTADSDVAYTMTIDVTAVNDPASGQPAIAGVPQAGADAERRDRHHR